MNKIVTLYIQIDYILLNQKHKHVLTDFRSYNGRTVFSDHRIVVSWLRSERFILRKEKVTSTQKNEHYNTTAIIQQL